MVHRAIEIIDDRSWSVDLRIRKQLRSYKIPQEFVDKYHLNDRDELSVSFYQSNVIIITDPKKKLTSGWEICLLKKQQSKLDRTIPVVIEITPPPKCVSETAYEEDNEPEAHLEGKPQIYIHQMKERNPALVQAAKKIWKAKDPLLHCCVCKFSFVNKYGVLGQDFIEAHHTIPLHTLTTEAKITINELIPVCSNCHRMLHRKNDVITAEKLKVSISK